MDKPTLTPIDFVKVAQNYLDSTWPKNDSLHEVFQPLIDLTKSLQQSLAAKEAVCESYEADRKLAIVGERQCFTTYQCAYRQRAIKQLTADLARLEQRVKELGG